jgi:hypothetical protein
MLNCLEGAWCARWQVVAVVGIGRLQPVRSVSPCHAYDHLHLLAAVIADPLAALTAAQRAAPKLHAHLSCMQCASPGLFVWARSATIPDSYTPHDMP